MKFRPGKVPLYLVVIVLTLIWILPVWTTFLVSFKSSQDFFEPEVLSASIRVFIF